MLNVTTARCSFTFSFCRNRLTLVRKQRKALCLRLYVAGRVVHSRESSLTHKKYDITNLENGLQCLPIPLDRGPMRLGHVVDRDFDFHNYFSFVFNLYVMLLTVATRVKQ